MLGKLVLKPYLYSALGIEIISAAIILIFRNRLPPVVPLFYGLPVGSKQLVPALGLLIAPGVGIIVSLANLIISLVVKDPFLKKTLILAAFFVSILVVVAVVKIIFLIGFF